jgi:hypothetical protein
LGGGRRRRLGIGVADGRKIEMPAFYRRHEAALAQPLLPQSEPVWVESRSLRTGILRPTQRRRRRHIAEVMSGIRRRHARPPDQKEAVLAEELMRMVETLDHGLRGLQARPLFGRDD